MRSKALNDIVKAGVKHMGSDGKLRDHDSESLLQSLHNVLSRYRVDRRSNMDALWQHGSPVLDRSYLQSIGYANLRERSRSRAQTLVDDVNEDAGTEGSSRLASPASDDPLQCHTKTSSITPLSTGPPTSTQQIIHSIADTDYSNTWASEEPYASEKKAGGRTCWYVTHAQHLRRTSLVRLADRHEVIHMIIRDVKDPTHALTEAINKLVRTLKPGSAGVAEVSRLRLANLRRVIAATSLAG